MSSSVLTLTPLEMTVLERLISLGLKLKSNYKIAGFFQVTRNDVLLYL